MTLYIKSQKNIVIEISEYRIKLEVKLFLR